MTLDTTLGVTELGPYRLLRRIAVGGMAELFVAVARGAGAFAKPVAIKRILPHLARESEFVAMFFDEARLAASLDHPHIAKVLDFGDEAGLPYIVMEFVHGVDLRGLMSAAGGAFPAEVAVTVAVQLAEALHHVHEQRDVTTGKPLGLVHRDVSPSNVLVGYSGGIKLTDFGIAKATSSTAYTATGALKGKLSYLAPEQARCERLDRRTDIYAMGLVLYELLTGRRMHRALSEVALLARVCDGEYTPPSEWVPDLDPQLEAITQRCLAPNMDDRFATAREVAVELEIVAADMQWTLAIGTLDRFVAANVTAPGPIILPTEPAPGSTAGPSLTPIDTVPQMPTRTRIPRPSRGRQLMIASGLLGLGIVIGLGPTLASSGAESDSDSDPVEAAEDAASAATVPTPVNAPPASPSALPSPSPSPAAPAITEPSTPAETHEPEDARPSSESSEPPEASAAPSRPSSKRRRRSSSKASKRKSKPATGLHKTLRPPSERN